LYTAKGSFDSAGLILPPSPPRLLQSGERGGTRYAKPSKTSGLTTHLHPRNMNQTLTSEHFNPRKIEHGWTAIAMLECCPYI
jgi:hypothetical protein